MVNNEPPRELEGLSGSAWKEKVVESLGIEPSSASAGQAAVLTGYRWSEVAKPEYRHHREVVLHRSPNVGKRQGRVLLVLDVKLKSSHKCSEMCCHHEH